MCDDYDTDFDSEEEGFERENLIDDIKKIQLALAESDVEEDDEEEEEEEEEDNTDFIETSSFKHHRSNIATSNIQGCTSQCQNTSPQDEPDVQPTLTELVPMTTVVYRNEQENGQNISGYHGYPLATDLSQPVKNTTISLPNEHRPGPSGCQLESGHNLPNILTVEQHKPEIPSNTSVDIVLGTITSIEPNNSVTQQQAIYNFASIQQGLAGQEEIDDNDEVIVDNEVDVSSLGVRETISLSLAQNRTYQAQILKELDSIEAALEDNQMKQLSLNQAKLNEEEEIQQALPSLIWFSTPYFRDSDGHGPPSNEDARHLRSLIGNGAYQAKSKTWNLKEEKALAEGVRMQNLKNKLSPLLISLKEAQSKLNVDPVEVALVNKQIKEVRELPPRALEQDLECLDWEKLSMEYLPKRTAIECQLHWCHFGHPRVNRKPWTKHEDKMLLKLTKDRDHDEINWNDIAQTIQTNRTPLQCYQRFQRSLNKEILRSKWTPEEDEQLTELVKIFGEGNWQRIADYLDGRMGEQCMNRYMKACKPARKGRWTTEENDNLVEAVRIVGNLNWEKVAEYVPGRTGTQCRERYMNVLNPTLKKGPWDKEEDQKLLQLVEKHGEGCWSLIAKDIVTRSDNQCWRRWNALRKEDSLYYRMNTLRKKREMVANFVNRRQEKPSLRPEDLDIQDIPIIVRPRHQRKETTKGNKNKRIKTERIEDDEDENQGSQPTSTPSPVMIPITSISELCTTTPISNTNDHSFTSTRNNHVIAPQTSHVITSKETSHVITPKETSHVITPKETSHVTRPKETSHVITPKETSHVITPKETSHVITPNESRRGVMGNHEISPKARNVIKRRVSESSDSDEDWNECDVTIDTTELGKRTSTRKRGNVKYSFDDDFVSDLSQDGEDEEEKEDEQVESVKQAKQVTQTKPDPRKRAPGDRSVAKAPSINTPTTTSTSTSSTAVPVPGPALALQPAPAPQPTRVPAPARVPARAPAPAPSPAPAPIPGAAPTPAPSPARVPAAAPPAAVQNQVLVQGSVASFSLLLQAFSINVSAVLQKVKPTPSQVAVQASGLTATTTGQQSTLASSTSEKNNCVNQSATSVITSQQSPVVPLASNKDNCSSQSFDEKSEASQQTGQQSLVASKICEETPSTTSQRSSTFSHPETRAQSPANNTKNNNKLDTRRESPKNSSPTCTGNEFAGSSLRSPSKRKSTTPRKTRRFSEQPTTLENLSDRIENLIQENEKVLATNKLSKKPLGDHGNQNSELKKPALPSIPPLPPCLTTLKGFKTLMSIKGQLEDLARKAVHANANGYVVNPVSTTSTNHSSTKGSTMSTTSTNHLSTKGSTMSTTSTNHSSTKGSTMSTTSTNSSTNASTSSTSNTLSAVITPLTETRLVSTPSAGSTVNVVSTTIPSATSCAINSTSATATQKLVSTPTTITGTTVVSAPSTRTPSSPITTVLSPTKPSVVSAPSMKNEQKSKRTTTDVQDKDPKKSKSTSTPVAIATSGISTNAAIPSGSREQTSLASPQSNSLTSHPVVDRLSQDPFVRYFLYRKSNEYKLLSSRFNSLFQWPMLMSKVPLVGKVPKDLFKAQSRQYTQNWGFPHMFALPPPAAPTVSAATVEITRPIPSAKITNPRKRSKKTKSSATRAKAASSASDRSRSRNQKDKDTNKQIDTNKQMNTNKTTPRIQRQKRVSQKSSVAFGEEVVPRKKRRVIAAILGESQENKKEQESAWRGISEGTATVQKVQNGPAKTNDSSDPNQ